MKLSTSSTIKNILLGMVMGSVITFFAFISYQLLSFQVIDNKNADLQSVEKKPLYWVAPMDVNYQRDEPGLSPMGMVLIPYYGEQESNANDSGEGPGTIRISADVINNLGVRTVAAKFKKLNSTINTLGYVTYDENLLIHIHPRVQGWVEKLYVKAVGDSVKKGQPLYDIYSPELVNAQEELVLALDRNNARLITAAENRLLALHLSAASITKLKNSGKVQNPVTFYAPQNGVVEKLIIREGYYVKPETMMMAIVDLSQVWVKAEVFERDVAKLAMGDLASMRSDYFPDKSWQGKVEDIHPMLNAKNRTGIARFSFDNTNRALKPNMFVKLSIATSNQQTVLQIPQEALIRTGKQDRVVLALGEGRFKSIEVSVGRFDDSHVEILSGLSAGEQVVSSAHFLLDSESSKSSDFRRMGNENKSHQIKNIEKNLSPISTATVNGTVLNINKNDSRVTIAREAIEKWQRSAAEVSFVVDKKVDFSLFFKGAYLMFTFEVHDDEFVIVSAMPMEKSPPGENE